MSLLIYIVPKGRFPPSVAMAIFSAGDRFSLRRRSDRPSDGQGKSQFGGQWKIAVWAINGEGGERGKELQLGTGVQMLDFQDK